jgi:3-hydroxy-D-aspartate aldolase
VSEAEALVRGCVGDVLITNEVVGGRKLARLASLAKRATVAVCVDNLDNLEDLNTVARTADVHIDVLVEIDVGGGRCGVQPGEPVLVLAERAQSSGNLRFKGLHAYQGRAQHVRAYAARRSLIEQSAEAIRRTLDSLSRRGLSCDVVTGGGTGTYLFETASGVYNELQAGSYIFMDADYQRNLNEVGTEVTDFRQSLFVYTQVMSTPGRNYVIVDAGLKALAFDSGMPTVGDFPNIRYCHPSDEHGVLDMSEAQGALSLGRKLKLIPGHCDPTVNLYDWYVAIRGDRVEALWPIVGRGAVL